MRAKVTYETDSNVLGNTWKVFWQSNALNIVENLVTPEWQEYNIRLICKICEQQEVNNDEKFNYSWPTSQENEIGVQPSSKTQGQLVGSIKCPWWKFTVRSRWAPGHLLLPY